MNTTQLAGLLATAVREAAPSQLEPLERTSLQMARIVDLTCPLGLALAGPIYQSLHAPRGSEGTLDQTLLELANHPNVQGLLEAVPELRTQLQRQIELVRSAGEEDTSQNLVEATSIQTAIMTTLWEIQKIERESYAENYRGIRQYRRALRGRLKDLARIRTTFEKGKPLSPRLQQRWERFRFSYLGEREDLYRGKVQQHLDLLRQVHSGDEQSRGEPLFNEMQVRQEEYLNQLKRIAVAETDGTSDADLAALRTERDSLERRCHKAVEAYYFLMGYAPTTWNGSFSEITRNFRWTRPATWIPPLLLGGLTTFLAADGVEPSSWDGAVFPAITKEWDGETLIVKSTHPPQGKGLSRQALYTALLDTLRLQLALVNTAGLDPEGRNFEGFIPSWFQTILAISGTTVRVEGLQNLKGLRDKNLIITPTHRGFIEYPLLLWLQDLVGHPFRIVAKDSFRTNPVIRALVGEAMVEYGFPFIDRAAGASAVATMQNIGKKVLDGNKSVVTYPPASRSPTLVLEGRRVEGPQYQAKHGVAFMAGAAGDAPIVPIAIIGSGVITPKSMDEQARGVPLGETVTVKIGTPFRASSLRGEGMDDEQAARAVAHHLDEEYERLTGLPTGPLYRSGAKTIFQASSLAELMDRLKERRPKKSGRRQWHHAVVTPPNWSPDEESLKPLASAIGIPKGGRLTVFRTTRNPDDTYSFPSYDIVG